ncbi:hypothetical protein M5238_002335 [Vibrio vulnificus]|nr:hypothetical protein [Vibrio vulnificus]
MSVSEVKRAVSSLLLNGDEWPPSLPEFIRLGLSLDIDFDEAFKRMIHGRPKGDVEYWACFEVGYECRRFLVNDKARAKFRKALKKYADKARAGTLPIRHLVKLSDKSKLVPVECLPRPEPTQFNHNSVFARVAALGKRV